MQLTVVLEIKTGSDSVASARIYNLMLGMQEIYSLGLFIRIEHTKPDLAVMVIVSLKGIQYHSVMHPNSISKSGLLLHK
jgi:hypothetical protein